MSAIRGPLPSSSSSPLLISLYSSATVYWILWKLGAFVSRFWFMLLPVKEHKIVVVSFDNAGKTTALYKLHLGEVCDLGGQERSRALWATFYCTHAVIILLDGADRAWISIMKDELFRLLQHWDLEHSVVLVFANKQDLKDAMSQAEITYALPLHSIKNHDWDIRPAVLLQVKGYMMAGMDSSVTQGWSCNNLI